VGLLGAMPFIGGIIQIASAVFVNPPLHAGLAYAVLRKIDGDPADVGNLFEAFRSRYWPSVLVTLPVMGLYLAGVIVLVVGVVIFMVVRQSLNAAAQQMAVTLGFIVLVPVVLVAIIVVMFMTSAIWFALVELWDGPASGWAAFVAGLRVAKDNFGSTLGLAIMLALVGFGAVVAGTLALCVGLLFTLPFLTVWIAAAHVYAYRSWSRSGATRVG
jgi:hypothetical protein